MSKAPQVFKNFIPATVRVIGADSLAGQRLLSNNLGRIRQFYTTQRGIADTGVISLNRGMIDAPEITMTYKKIQGQEYVDVILRPRAHRFRKIPYKFGVPTVITSHLGVTLALNVDSSSPGNRVIYCAVGAALYDPLLGADAIHPSTLYYDNNFTRLGIAQTNYSIFATPPAILTYSLPAVPSDTNYYALSEPQKTAGELGRHVVGTSAAIDIYKAVTVGFDVTRTFYQTVTFDVSGFSFTGLGTTYTNKGPVTINYAGRNMGPYLALTPKLIGVPAPNPRLNAKYITIPDDSFDPSV